MSKTKELNEQLSKAIEQLSEAIGRDNILAKKYYDEIRALIANDELLPITDEVYSLLFLNEYPSFANFLLMLKDNDLQDILSFFMANVPENFVCGEGRRGSLANIPLITFTFYYKQDLIPNLLEVILKSGRSDIVLKENLVSSIERRIQNIENTGKPYSANESCAAYSCSGKNQDYYNAKKAIEEYCIKNEDGSYKVIPDYILPIQNESQELKQCFKDIATAINSNNLDEVKNTLGTVESADKINVDSVKKSLCVLVKQAQSVDSVTKALCVLVKQAQSNEEIMHAISNCQADMSFPTMLENTDATPSSGSIGRV